MVAKMIVYSQTGTKPNELAFKKILLAKKFAITFVKDNKYVIKREPTEEYMNEVFNEKLPYCISDGASSNTKSVQPFWNPKIVCKASNGDWVAFSDYKMQPIGKYTKMDKLDVYYSDLKYKQEPIIKQKLLPLIYGGLNAYARPLVTCFTKQFDLPYATFDSDKKRWLRNVSLYIARPYYYEHCLYIGKCGGWCIDESILDIDWSKLKDGVIPNKKLGRIEAYTTKYIEEQKRDVLKVGDSFSYVDKEYYECEMQAVFVLLHACKLLQRHKKALTADNVLGLLSYIHVETTYAKNVGCPIEEYFAWHVDELDAKGLI